ncbi:phage tail fiber protein [Megasphaera sp.]|uniref:phage tail fiber domain-containing protein n=1 Tax=Megasphaera sp. TaxID=2023260 RepID=UPI0035219A33
MANTTGFKARVEYEVTDGTKTTYTFPFSYLRKKFVMVSILHSDATETALEYGVGYTVNDLSVSLTTPTQVGEHIIIYRQTSTDKIVTWNDGSILLARDMNTEDAQMLHLQEEQQDYIMAHAISTKVTSDKEVLWDALNHRVINVSDPKDPQDVVTKNYMETVQGGFVAANTILVQEATKQASAAKSSQEAAKTSETNAKTSETNSEISHQKAKKWAEATDSPDGEADTDSTTGKTQSSKEWALYSKTKAQEAATSATNAKSSETNAKTSETNAKSSETKAKTYETNAKTSETNASASASASASSASASATSATNAHNSETAAANSAKQAAESAGVFQDFKGATADTDGNGGKVPKPLAGQQGRYLKADGTWSDIPKLTPNTLWDTLHSYGENYVPSDTSNNGWNKLGFTSIFYTQNKIKQQPGQYGQLINIPADLGDESAQLWIAQNSGHLYYRGGNSAKPINETEFKAVPTPEAIDACEKVNSQGSNWIRYESGLQLCWNSWIDANAWWSFPVAFSGTPAVTVTARSGNWQWVDSLSNTGFTNKGNGGVCAIAVGRWK